MRPRAHPRRLVVRSENAEAHPGSATVGRVRHVLSDGDFDALGSGQLVTPVGGTYTRRTTRMKRRDVDVAIAAGSPLVTWSPGGALVWHDGDDAGPAWAQARPILTAEPPIRRGENP